MTKIKLFFSFFLLLATGDLRAQEVATPLETPNDSLAVFHPYIESANWKVSKIANGVTWKYFHFDDLYASKQFITIIEVDPSKNIAVGMPYITKGFMKTSKAAVEENAIAAVNGSFFDTKVGGSTVFLRKNGEIINLTRGKFTHYREEAGFSIDKDGTVSIVKRPTEAEGGWPSVDAYTHLASGPLLVYDGEIMDQLDQPFNTNRHPRTAIGITANKRIICVVVDGRSSESYGMSTPELANLMYALGCEQAMNLDGGGSSTAWVRGKGIVNHPTDNKKFDSEGERAVANAIIFTGD
ncbi:phosphodiester glycosidase family protein [Albibacterium profundi]|uniref:Phosphodiester glycosidase family protein n=1 Tax=Albibacterium profundi TaxID=3134906 RepID=A0ABV5CDY0_9SPHI